MRYFFKLETPQRSYQFSANSEVEANDWIQDLCKEVFKGNSTPAVAATTPAPPTRAQPPVPAAYRTDGHSVHTPGPKPSVSQSTLTLPLARVTGLCWLDATVTLVRKIFCALHFILHPYPSLLVLHS
jgi:hypothetical protein